MSSANPTLRRALTTPFILYVEARETPEGWMRRASFPELVGCEVYAAKSWEAVERLEAELPRYIVSRVATGAHIPIPLDRPVIGNITAEEVLESAGLLSWADRLDEPIASLAPHHA